MINKNPYAKYQQNQVQTANPEKLIIMLYDGAVKFLEQAKGGIEKQDYEKANTFICKTQNIISELMSSLDMGYEISHNLLSLYDFMYFTLVQANIKKDLVMVSEVQTLLVELRDTWAKAILISKSQHSQVANGVNFSG